MLSICGLVRAKVFLALVMVPSLIIHMKIVMAWLVERLIASTKQLKEQCGSVRLEE